LCEALLVVLDSSKYPLYIHCNQGRHRTGCLIGCLRKVQRWPIEDVLAEYHAYASPKARPGDVELIRSFDPQCVFEYAKRHGHLEDLSLLKRMDSTIANIDMLAEALSGGANLEDVFETPAPSECSNLSDDLLEMSASFYDISLVERKQPAGRPALQRMTSQPTPLATQNMDDGESDLQSDIGEAEPSALSNPQPTFEGASTSVVELAEDALTPPAEEW
jgi:hypothetical protein